MAATLKRPSALLPIAMSLAALALGRLPRDPRGTVLVLGLQAAAGLAVAAPVFLLNL